MGENTVRNAVRAACAVAVCFVLAACGIRLETPPPSPLSPGANEVARQSAVDSLLEIESLALMLDGASGSEEIDDLISTVAIEARSQVNALGGPYDSGLGREPEESTPPPAAHQQPPTVEDLHTMLLASALRLRATLPLVPDGSLARLLSSTSLSHTQRAYQISQLTDLEINIDDLAVPEPEAASETASGVGQSAPEPPDDVTRSPDADEPDLADEVESPVVARETQDSRVPVELPEGISPSQLLAIIVDEDALGYIQEVRATRLDEDFQAEEFTRASVHRLRARDWADVSGLAYTDSDPRQIRYHLAADLGSEEVADELQAQIRQQLVALTDHYVTLVADAEFSSRIVIHDLAILTMIEGLAAGEDYGPFPGMPDLTR